MLNILSYNDIECIDVDISNICNLKCPLCMSLLYALSLPKHFADIQYLVLRIKQFHHVKTLHIGGIASEPTLHQNIFLFLDAFKHTNISVNLFTNGSTHYDDLFWNYLPNHLNEKSKVVFTICGTTLQLHEKYRVGSNLNKLVDNILKFKSTSLYHNDYVLYIRFQYNKHEKLSEIEDFMKKFSDYGILDTDTICERFLEHAKNAMLNRICSDLQFSVEYSNRLKQIKNLKLDILCNSFERRIILMDPYGKVYPCAAYRLFSNCIFDNGSELDYAHILSNECNFCFECNKSNLQYLDLHNRDAFYMCNSKVS